MFFSTIKKQRIIKKKEIQKAKKKKNNIGRYWLRNPQSAEIIIKEIFVIKLKAIH